MKKILKAQDISVVFVTDDAAMDKGAFEQLILACKRSANWGVSTDADLTITHCDTVDGTYTAFATINVAPGATGTVLEEVNLVAMKQFFKISIEEATGNDIVDVVAIFADDRLVDTADVLPLVVNPTPRDTLSLNAYNI